MAIQSGGVVVKTPNQTLWTGTPGTWYGWPGSASLNYWASYAAMYRDHLWVGTVVDKRAKATARLPLKVYERDELNRPEARDHPYARLLRNPNERQSAFFFWLWMSSMFDIYGETFAGKIRDAGGRPTQLIPLHPTAMYPEEEKDGRVLWRFQNSTVRIDGIPDEDLLHLRTFNTDSFTRGLSPLEKLRRTLENEDASRRATSSFWQHGARPGVVLTHPNVISQGAADRLKVGWNALTAGADKTGTTVVLEEGMKAEKLMLTAEEAQYIESRKLNQTEVCAAYDIPPPVVHILEHATYSNIVEQMRSMYRDTMGPHLRGFEAELETQVRGSVRPGASEPDFGDGVYAEFLLDEVLRGDFEARQDAYQKADFMTLAEKRQRENLPFIEGTNVILVNGAMVPVAGDDAPSTPTFAPTPAVAAVEGAVRSLTPDELRTLMGRLSRPKSVEEIDVVELTKGMNGSTPVIEAAVTDAKEAGESVGDLRSRLKELVAVEPVDPLLELAKSVADLAARPQAAPVVNVGSGVRTIERDERDNITRIVDE